MYLESGVKTFMTLTDVSTMLEEIGIHVQLDKREILQA